MNKKIPLFEDFIPAGFRMYNTQPYAISTGAVSNSGYSMDAIAGPVMKLSNSVAESAYAYESNENPNHKGDEFITEAKKHVCKKIDEAYNNSERNA